MNSTLSYFFISLIYIWTSFLLFSIPPFSSTASASDFSFPSSSSANDDDNLIFSDEETPTASSDSPSLFDATLTTPETVLETEPLPPFLAAESSPSSGCPSSFFSDDNNPQPVRRLRLRRLLTTRQSLKRGGGDSCTAPPVIKSQSGSPFGSSSSQNPNLNPNLDLGLLGIMENPSESYCSDFVGWAFGSIPVCSVDDPDGVPSEEDLNEPELLQTIKLSGYRNFVDCYQITPFNFFLCPDNHAWCCNSFLPDVHEATLGKGFWCMRATRKGPI